MQPAFPAFFREWIFRPERLLCLLVPAIFVLTALAPRGGSGALLLSASNAQAGPVMQWAVQHGAAIAGSTAVGGIVLDRAPPGLLPKAMSHGMIAIAIPAALCADQNQNRTRP